jgi:hypothetical protein
MHAETTRVLRPPFLSWGTASHTAFKRFDWSAVKKDGSPAVAAHTFLPSLPQLPHFIFSLVGPLTWRAVKKKESKLYGAHFKDVDHTQKAKKTTFDSDDDE